MMQIYLVHGRYNWDSYSLIRSMHEILNEREDVEYFTDQNADDMQPGGYIWVYSSVQGVLNYLEMKKRGLIIVNFGLSEPNLFLNEERLKVCDVYCTNDLNTYRKYKNDFKIYHFKPGCNLKRFKKMDIKKDIDVLFIGTLKHNFIPMRKKYIMKLRKEVFDFRGYGKGFERFLSGEDLIETYNRAHLNLDICTKVSSLSNSRILQAAACGAPTLTLKREDVLQDFEDGKEILTYEGGYEEMLSAIQKALQDKDRLAEIGENARKRCIAEHGMRKRVDDLINYLGEVDGSTNKT